MSQPLHVVLASPTGDGLMSGLATAMEEAGFDVTRVALDPTRAEGELADCMRAAAEASSGRLVLGGYSLGARVAAELCSELMPVALLLFGYPFHRAGAPTERHGLEALRAVVAPALIVQGTRDTHGSEADVRGYTLPTSVALCWLRDGNHGFVPRGRSGLSHEAHLSTATAAALSFLRSR